MELSGRVRGNNENANDRNNNGIAYFDNNGSDGNHRNRFFCWWFPGLLLEYYNTG